MNHLKNYYEILNLEETIIVNYDNLEKAYLSKQIEYFGDTDAQNMLNEAFQTLKKPVKRVEHFFLIKDITITNINEPELLELFFELNERIEGIEDKDGLNKINNELNVELANIIQLINNNFIASKNNELNILLTKLRYIGRAIELIQVNAFKY